MNAPAELAQGGISSAREAGRWAAAAVVVMLAHAGIVYAFQALAPVAPPREAMEQALEIDLSPLAVSTPEAVESEPVEEVEETEALQPVEDEPIETAETLERVEPEEAPTLHAETVEPVEPEQLAEIVPEAEMVAPEIVTPVTPEVVLPKPKPKPVAKVEPKPKKRPKVEVAKQEPRKKPEAIKPSSKASQKSQASKAPTVSPARWQARVLSWINRHKRYPASARAGGVQGTARVSFSINSSGAVTSVRLSKSSGSAELDRAAVDMVRRSSPVPAPPAGVGGSRINLSLPVSFSLN